MDQQFLNATEQLKNAGISCNEALLPSIKNRMLLYQDNSDKPEFPLWLLARELGRKYSDATTNEYVQFCSSVSTIVLEEYFLNYYSLGFIFNELKRISQNNINIRVIEESPFDEDNSPDVTIQFQSNGETHTLEHEDEYGDCGLDYDFLREELLPKLKGTVTKGHIYWITDGLSFTFMYTEDQEKFQELKFEKGFKKL